MQRGLVREIPMTPRLGATAFVLEPDGLRMIVTFDFNLKQKQKGDMTIARVKLLLNSHFGGRLFNFIGRFATGQGARRVAKAWRRGRD